MKGGSRVPSYILRSCDSKSSLVFRDLVPAQLVEPKIVDANRPLPTKYTQAWATHDGRKLTELMSDNIDWITVGGTWYRGRKDFEAYHTGLLAGRFREAQMTALEKKVDFIRPDLAFVRWSWRMEGDKNFDGTPRLPRVGIITMVAEKQGDAWKIIAGQNTNGIPAPPTRLPEEECITFPITLPDPEKK